MLELVSKGLDLFNSLIFLLFLSFSLCFTTQLRLFGKNISHPEQIYKYIHIVNQRILLQFALYFDKIADFHICNIKSRLQDFFINEKCPELG